MRAANRHLLIVIALATALMAGSLVGAQEQPAEEETPVADDITVVRAAEVLDPTEVSVRFSEQVHPTGVPVPFAVLASTAGFADALSSSVLQRSGPLLLVPPTLPLPGRLLAELRRLDPDQVLVLGGPAAIGAEVLDELARLGFDVAPTISGATRIETAIEVARVAAPDAEFALLARAFPTGADETQAWADSVTAGAMSAQVGWPVLLTESGDLNPVTLDYLRESRIRVIGVVGGPQAVSDRVLEVLRAAGYEVHRVGGGTRFDTAIGVAVVRQVIGARRAVIIDGTSPEGWQAGLVAAGHAAAEGAAILPLAGTTVPDPIRAYLEGAPPQVLTCAVPRVACEDVRALAGLPTRPLISYAPPPGTAMAKDEQVVVGVDDPQRILAGEAEVASDCTVGPIRYLPEGTASFALDVGDEEGGGDQPQPSGPVPVQPQPGSGEATGPSTTPAPTATPEPIEANEAAPAGPPLTTCTVETSFLTRDGGVVTDVATFHVVDLRPRIRVTSFRQVQGAPVTFLDRSDGIIDTWEWRFGEGSAASTDINPTHTYSSPGCMDVQLTVTSPLRHWLTGRLFTDTEVRTVAVDPASTSRGHVEVLAVEASDGALGVGEDIQMRTTDGQLMRTETVGADGRAVFDRVAPGTYDFTYAADPTDVIRQVVPGGHTLCPVLLLGETGSLLVTVLDDDTGQSISGAEIQVTFGGETVGSGLSDARGKYFLEDLPVGGYSISVTAAGYLPSTASATVVEDMVADGVVPMRRPAPTPTPTPTP